MNHYFINNNSKVSRDSDYKLHSHRELRRDNIYNDWSQKVNHLPITSRNLRRLNWLENRSLTRESLIGGMIKGDKLHFSYSNITVINPINKLSSEA